MVETQETNTVEHPIVLTITTRDGLLKYDIRNIVGNEEYLLSTMISDIYLERKVLVLDTDKEYFKLLADILSVLKRSNPNLSVSLD